MLPGARLILLEAVILFGLPHDLAGALGRAVRRVVQLGATSASRN